MCARASEGTLDQPLLSLYLGASVWERNSGFLYIHPHRLFHSLLRTPLFRFYRLSTSHSRGTIVLVVRRGILLCFPFTHYLSSLPHLSNFYPNSSLHIPLIHPCTSKLQSHSHVCSFRNRIWYRLDWNSCVILIHPFSVSPSKSPTPSPNTSPFSHFN